MRLLMCRHGETVANVEKKYQGWQDTPLTKAGIKAAGELRDFLKSEAIDVVACSTIGRAKATAAILLEGRDIPIYYYDELKEMNLGSWDGKTLESLADDPLSDMMFNQPHKFRAPAGEDFFELKERALRKVQELFEQYPDKTVLLVAHGLTLRVLMNHFYKNPVSELRRGTKFLYSCSLSIVDYRGPNDFTVIQEGDTSHLSAEVG